IVAEDQPYAKDASPTTQSPEYVPESDLEAHPEDDDDEDPEEDPVDYPTDGGDDGDDEEGHTMQYRMTAKISIPTPVPMPTWSDSEIVRLLAMSSPPASPLSPWEDRPEVTLLPQKRLGITLGPGYEVGGSSSAATTRSAGGLRADYGFVATIDREIMRDPQREVRPTDASDLVRGKVMSLRTTVLGHMTEIKELHAADRRRHIVISELLRADHRRSTKIIKLRTTLQGQVTALQGQVIALQAQVTALQGQQGLAGGPTQPELLEEAGSGS
nr:hypothetical protein [Tanacetum cinerariifolium]